MLQSGQGRPQKFFQGRANVVFRKIDCHSRTFLWAGPMFNVKFGVMREEHSPMAPPLLAPGACPTLAKL